MVRQSKTIEVEKIWLTTKEAMKYLGVSRDFLDNLRQSGELGYYKVGHTILFKKDRIDKLIESHKVF